MGRQRNFKEQEKSQEEELSEMETTKIADADYKQRYNEYLKAHKT